MAAPSVGNVPTSDGSALGGWVSRQRALERQGKLLAERRARLLSLSFEFDPLAARWERRLSDYAKAVAAEGTPVPEKLASWASRQRAAHMLVGARVEEGDVEEAGAWPWAEVEGAGGERGAGA